MTANKRIHIIAIGGAIMHNLAIALKLKGHAVSGSDDKIYDPAKSNLSEHGLLPAEGWDVSNIVEELDLVILGMHARVDNVELKAAQDRGVPIVSFPAYIAEHARDKKRVVIAGSHGKTTTTAMIMHVLNELQMDFDYLVGSSLPGFDLSVRLSDAPIILIEGDEYLTSPLDRRSKFLWYEPHVSIITGIAYDHINVFPTYSLYLDTFSAFLDSHAEGATCFAYAEDEDLQRLVRDTNTHVVNYTTPHYATGKAGSTITLGDTSYALSIVGKHNIENMRVAQLVCGELGISEDDFYAAAESFAGAGRRMEKIYETDSQVVYRDFAHSPSKLKATVQAIDEAYDGPLLAVFELHTFSSLTRDFLPLYLATMDAATEAVVFYNEEVFTHKKMEYLSADYVKECFGAVQVINDKEKLEKRVHQHFENGDHILLMSSGKFDGAQFQF